MTNMHLFLVTVVWLAAHGRAFHLSEIFHVGLAFLNSTFLFSKFRCIFRHLPKLEGRNFLMQLEKSAGL